MVHKTKLKYYLLKVLKKEYALLLKFNFLIVYAESPTQARSIVQEIYYNKELPAGFFLVEEHVTCERVPILKSPKIFLKGILLK